MLGTPRARRLYFAALYFSEGAPIGYVWWALPTRLREAGVPIDDVTRLTALVTLPWAFKFLWAPLVDAFRSSRLGLRAWIVGAQLAMGLTLLPVAAVELPGGYDVLVWLLLLHALCAATQDVSIDALAVATVPVHERGAVAGWMQVGMLAGRAAFGGVALMVEQRVGAAATVVLLAGTIWTTSLLALLAGPSGPAVAVPSPARRFAAVLRAALARRATWLGLAFALLAVCAMEATGAVTGPLLVDRGFSSEAAGRFFAGPAIAGMALGALLGGRLSDRGERGRVLAAALVALAVIVAGVALAATPLGGRWPVVGALAVAFVGFGVLTAAAYALLMDLTDPALGGTQFSAYMGAVNAGAVWSTWLVGRLAERFDYPAALLAMAALSLLALPLLPSLSRAASPRAYPSER